MYQDFITKKIIIVLNLLYGDTVTFNLLYVDGHLDPFSFLAIMNKAALNIPVYVFWYIGVHLCSNLLRSHVAGT